MARMRAFTLIEMMVSISIFLIVMVIALGAVFAIVDGNKKAQAINSVSNNLSSAVESMVRDIKTGYGYSCGNPSMPLGGGDTSFSVGEGTCPFDSEARNMEEIAFVSTISGDKRSVKYSLDDQNGRAGILKTFCPAYKTLCGAGDYVSVPITSPDIDVQSLEFRVRRPVKASDTSVGNDRGQPSVFILIKGTAYVNKTKSSDFSMQTLVSQRVLNI